MILIDTHVLVWAVLGIDRLGTKALFLLESEGALHMSAMASWEIAMTADKGRLELGMPVERWIDMAHHAARIEEVPVSAAIAFDAGSMRGGLHGDPCDRIMIATARALDCPLMTADAKTLAYAAAGHLKAIDARV